MHTGDSWVAVTAGRLEEPAAPGAQTRVRAGGREVRPGPKPASGGSEKCDSTEAAGSRAGALLRPCDRTSRRLPQAEGGDTRPERGFQGDTEQEGLGC